jgi:hypothetical protein
MMSVKNLPVYLSLSLQHHVAYLCSKQKKNHLYLLNIILFRASRKRREGHSFVFLAALCKAGAARVFCPLLPGQTLHLLLSSARKYPETARKQPGNSQETARKQPGNSLEIARKQPGNSLERLPHILPGMRQEEYKITHYTDYRNIHHWHGFTEPRTTLPKVIVVKREKSSFNCNICTSVSFYQLVYT